MSENYPRLAESNHQDPVLQVPHDHDGSTNEIAASSIAAEKFQAHDGIIEACLASGILEDTEDGVFGDVTWHRTDRLGKHQIVAIVDFMMPGGEVLPAVVRPTYSEFSVLVQEYPAIAELYPGIYGSLPQPSSDPEINDAEILLIEKIGGPHGDHLDEAVREQYTHLIETPEGFDQLCQEVFAMVDEIHSFPVQVGDVNPVNGHNIAYDMAKQRFRLFDVDTLKRSDSSHTQKFLEFMGGSLNGHNNSQFHLAFVARMMQMYQEKYPDQELAYESPVQEVAFYGFADDTGSPEGTLIYRDKEKDSLDDDRYFAAWSRFRDRVGGKVASMDLLRSDPVLMETVKTGRYVSTISQEMLNALSSNDLATLEQLIAERDLHQLVDTRFVEQ